MPTLSRYFVRSALIWLAVGFTFGGLILAAKGGADTIWAWRLLPAHIMLLLLGWLVQLSMGVAYWILPRILLHERGRSRWAWVSFGCFQVGLIGVALSGLDLWLPELRALFMPAVIVIMLGVCCFAIHAWPRIHPTFVRAGKISSS